MSAIDAYGEYPITEPVQPVRPETVVRVGTRSWMPLRETFAPVGRAARRAHSAGKAAASATRIGAAWVRYGWQVTAAPRAGYGNYRRARNNFINNVKGEQDYQELRAIAADTTKDKKRDAALEDCRAKRRSIDRQSGPRAFIAYLPTFATLGGDMYLHATLPAWQEGGVVLAASTAAVGLFTMAGKRVEDLPEAKRPARKGALSDRAIWNALLKLGIPQLTIAMTEDPESIYISPVVELADKSGWTAVINLCPGVERAKVLGKRELLAQNLHAKHESCLTLNDGDSTSEIIITLTKQRPSERKPVESPLVREDVNHWEPAPLGTDAGVKPATVKLNRNIIVVGATGSGKSVLMQNIIGASVVNPTGETILWGGKGLTDYAHFERSLDYVAAMDADKHGDPMRAEGDKICNYLSDKASERIDLLGRLGKPKVTPELELQHPELHRIVAVFDEAQYYVSDDKTIERVARLAQRTRSLNIIIALAVPSIGKLNSKEFLGPFRIRFALGLGAQWETQALCGDDAQRMGYKPHDPNHTPGTVVVAGDGPLRRFQVAELTEDQQRAIAARGGAVEKLNLKFDAPDLKFDPETFNTLNGELLGPSEAQPDPRLKLLHDVIAVATPTAEQVAADPLSEFVVQTDPLVGMLRKHSPEYKSLTTSDLRKRMEGFGLRSHQKNYDDGSTKASRRGWWFSEIHNIINKGDN